MNELSYFHVCNPGLPPCIAHDLFESIVPYDLIYCIKYFVTEHWFTYNFLNSRLQKIKFLNESTNISISLIRNSVKVTGTASQIKRILLIFPLAVFNSIKNTKDDIWLLLLLLREICCLTCAFALSFGQVALLQEKINEYLSLRLKCFSQFKLRPKHHYISHYPSLIISFGPLKHLWTLHFESKHRYFKNIIKHSQNFKNITQLLSIKHQLLQSSCSMNIYRMSVIADKTVEYISENFSCDISSVITDYFHHNPHENFRYVASQVTFKGIKYKRDMCVCVGKNVDGFFTLCKIKYFLVNNSYTNIYFVDITTDIIYDSNFGIYEQFDVQNSECKTNKMLLFPYSSLLAQHPVLEIYLNSIPVYVFQYAPLDL